MSKTQQSTALCLLGQGPSPIHHNLAVMPDFWCMTLSPRTFGAQPTRLQTMRAALFKIDKNDMLFCGKHAKICRTAVDGKQPFRSYDYYDLGCVHGTFWSSNFIVNDRKGSTTPPPLSPFEDFSPLHTLQLHPGDKAEIAPACWTSISF
jgi:hypothetical protein